MFTQGFGLLWLSGLGLSVKAGLLINRPPNRRASFLESSRDGEREGKGERTGPSPSPGQCGNDSAARSRTVTQEVALRWLQGGRGVEGDVSMPQRSRDKAGWKSHSGMLPGQGQVTLEGKTNFLDRHRASNPGGRDRGVDHDFAGAAGSLQAMGKGLEKSLSLICLQQYTLEASGPQYHPWALSLAGDSRVSVYPTGEQPGQVLTRRNLRSEQSASWRGYKTGGKHSDCTWGLGQGRPPPTLSIASRRSLSSGLGLG